MKNFTLVTTSGKRRYFATLEAATRVASAIFAATGVVVAIEKV